MYGQSNLVKSDQFVEISMVFFRVCTDKYTLLRQDLLQFVLAEEATPLIGRSLVIFIVWQRACR